MTTGQTRNTRLLSRQRRRLGRQPAHVMRGFFWRRGRWFLPSSGERTAMAKQQPTPHQLAVYKARLHAIDRAWREERESFFVNGQRPAWLGAGFALLMAFGLVLLVWCLRLLLAGEPVLRLAFLMGVWFSAV